MLLDELRIAYRGWDTVATQLDAEARRHKPTIASSVTDEFRAVMEQMKSSEQARSSQAVTGSMSTTINLISTDQRPSKDSNVSSILTHISSDSVPKTITTHSASTCMYCNDGKEPEVHCTNGLTKVAAAVATTTTTTTTTTSIHQVSTVPVVSAGTIVHKRRDDVSLPSPSSSTSADVGRGFLSMVDEIEEEINSKYGYTSGGHGGSSSSMDVNTKRDPLQLSKKSQMSGSTGSGKVPPSKSNNKAVSARRGTDGSRGGEGVFKPTVGLGASAELQLAYELLLKKQLIKDGS